MQAQTKSPAAVVAAPDATATLVRTIVALVATATLLFLFRPTVIHAQDKTASHTVASGETLWSLATRFYGDGHKWPELVKLNGLGDSGEKQLVVGQVIKVPAEKGAVAGKPSVTPPSDAPRAAVQRAVQPSKDAASATITASAPGALASQTANKSDAAPKAPSGAVSRSSALNVASVPAKTAATATKSASTKPDAKPHVVANPSAPIPAPVVEAQSATAPEKFAEPVAATATRIWGADLASMRDARGAEQSTIFLGRVYDPAETESAVKAVLPVNKVRERAGEYSGAPYAVAAASLVSAGVVGRRASSAGGSFRDTERLLLLDEVEVTLPTGVMASVGARLVSVEQGSLLKSGAQVVLPTGVLEVIKVEAGRPTIARVVRQSGRIQEGQYLVPLEGSGIVNGVLAKAVPRSSTVPETEVTWVESALLPTLQSYVVLGSGEREGVKAGDEFALVTRQGLGADAVENRVALVRVVRVTPFGSSAIVVRQDSPTIAVGGAARLVARVP